MYSLKCLSTSETSSTAGLGHKPALMTQRDPISDLALSFTSQRKKMLVNWCIGGPIHLFKTTLSI